MRPSQVTYQGRFYYHCAFTAPAKHPLEMHTYICSRYLYMYACSWVCHWEWVVVGMLGPDAVTVCVVVCSHAFRSVYVRRLWMKKKEKNATFFLKSDCNLQMLLVLLQDVQLFPNVVTDSVLISSSSWLWPWTSPMRCIWWLMGNSELRSGLVLHSKAKFGVVSHEAPVARITSHSLPYIIFYPTNSINITDAIRSHSHQRQRPKDFQ